MRQQICSRRPIQAPTGVFPPNESAGLSARSCVTSQVHEGISPGFFLPQQGIVSMLFSGAGRQPISASPVLFLANEVWVTWLEIKNPKCLYCPVPRLPLSRGCSLIYKSAPGTLVGLSVGLSLFFSNIYYKSITHISKSLPCFQLLSIGPKTEFGLSRPFIIHCIWIAIRTQAKA